MFILVAAAAVIYFIGLTIGLYVCALKKWDDSGPFGAIFWPVWVPLFLTFIGPVMLIMLAWELGEKHRKGDKK